MSRKLGRGDLSGPENAVPRAPARSEMDSQFLRAVRNRSGGSSIEPEFEIGTLQDLLVAMESFVAKLSNPVDLSQAALILPSALRQAERLGVRRSQLADNCHVSEASISRWASGQSTPMAMVARAAMDELRDLMLQEMDRVQGRIDRIRDEHMTALR